MNKPPKAGREDEEERLKRNVKLNSFEDLLDELGKIERAKEIKTFGVWSVYQILEHISENLYGSLHGFPKHLPKIARMTVGKFMLRKILKSGYMRSGYPNPNTPKVREEGDILSSLQKLRSIIEEFRNHKGNYAMHPIFDRLTGEQWTELHLIHFSLHLSFIEVVEEVKKSQEPDEKSQNSEPEKVIRRPAYVLSETEIIIDDEDEEPIPTKQDNPGTAENLEIQEKSPESEVRIEEKSIEPPEENSFNNIDVPPEEKEDSPEEPEVNSKKKASSKKSSTAHSKKKSVGTESPTPSVSKTKKKSAGKKK